MLTTHIHTHTHTHTHSGVESKSGGGLGQKRKRAHSYDEEAMSNSDSDLVPQRRDDSYSHTPRHAPRVRQSARHVDKKARTPRGGKKLKAKVIGSYVEIVNGRFDGEFGFCNKGGNGYFSVVLAVSAVEQSGNKYVNERENSIMKRSGDLRVIELDSELEDQLQDVGRPGSVDAISCVKEYEQARQGGPRTVKTKFHSPPRARRSKESSYGRSHAPSHARRRVRAMSQHSRAHQERERVPVTQLSPQEKSILEYAAFCLTSLTSQ
jgi:hypothetical protein